MIPPDPNAALRAALDATRRRLLLRRAVRGGAVGAWAGVLAGGVSAALAHHWIGWAWGPSAAIAVAFTGVGVAVGFGVAAFWKGLDRRELALLIDRALGTDELLITALHLGESDPDEGKRLLAELDIDIADLAVKLPVSAPRHTPGLALPAVAIAAILMVPTLRPPSITPDAKDQVQAEGERLADRIDDFEEEDEAELPEGIEREIAKLASDMQGDILEEEEALARLEDLQERLSTFADELAESESMLEDLERAAKELDAKATQELADALRSGDLDAASNAAKDLSESLSEATAEERQQAGESLKNAGEELSKSNSEALKQAGNAMKETGQQVAEGSKSAEGQAGERPDGAEAAQSGNEKMSQEQIQQMSEQLAKARELGEQLQSDQKALDRAQKLNGAMEASKQRLGGDSEVASGESSEGSEGSEGGEGGEGGEEGQAGKAGQQAGPNHTWEDQGEHDAGKGQQHEDRNSDSTEGEVIDDYEKLYASVRMENADALLASVKGQVDENGQIDELHTKLTGAEEDATVDGIELPAQYREAAAEAMSAEEIPPGYRDAVKQYFDEME